MSVSDFKINQGYIVLLGTYKINGCTSMFSASLSVGAKSYALERVTEISEG